jgi:acetyl-CoA synthetase
MSNVFNPPAAFTEGAWIKSREEYQKMYDRSIQDPAGFWGEIAEQFHWYKKWDKVFDFNYDRREGKVQHQWYINGKTNITYNCLDRHLDTRGDQTAILWVGNNPVRIAPTPTRSCTSRSASSPTCSRPRASRRATASASTCR